MQQSFRPNMPNGYTEEWAVRLEKRTAAIQRVRSQYGDGGPPPPDAEDRGLSKRVWEKLFLEWRLAVRDSALAEKCSTSDSTK